MDKLQYIQEVESKLNRHIKSFTSIEKAVYKLFERGASTDCVKRLLWDQRNDDCMEPLDEEFPIFL